MCLDPDQIQYLLPSFIHSGKHTFILGVFVFHITELQLAGVLSAMTDMVGVKSGPFSSFSAKDLSDFQWALFCCSGQTSDDDKFLQSVILNNSNATQFPFDTD